ncbi:homocysteine S-methyltransferase [Nakamurella deserti]|uniref:homocysteine S-methyltransferase n=1 Tax=Nakamurella deserti TaxID=2164074 RepID=UPI000DBE7CFA|nr:homocysteine S-methyltransferase [Nakamurella deserti]
MSAPPPHVPLAEALTAGPVVLDGGLGTLLEARGADLTSSLWSARLLRDGPGAIEAAHREYFEAGAQVAITSSYQASFEGLAELGTDRAAAAALMTASVDIARRARDVVRPDGWVAASVGPYGAVLADGSEYRGDYGLSAEELRDWHRPRLEVLRAAGADVLAVETVPSLAEAAAVLGLIAGTGHPAWLSLTVDGERTRTGEPLDEVYAMAAEVPEIIALGVNCTAPDDVAAAVAIAARYRPVVVYPNSGQGWDAVRRRWTGSAAFDADQVREWIDAGARLVGGCCRIGPAEITAVAAAARGR